MKIRSKISYMGLLLVLLTTVPIDGITVIPEEKLDRISDSFAQADGSITRWE